jgi:hypothetical protein
VFFVTRIAHAEDAHEFCAQLRIRTLCRRYLRGLLPGRHSGPQARSLTLGDAGHEEHSENRSS